MGCLEGAGGNCDDAETVRTQHVQSSATKKKDKEEPVMPVLREHRKKDGFWRQPWLAGEREWRERPEGPA